MIAILAHGIDLGKVSQVLAASVVVLVCIATILLDVFVKPTRLRRHPGWVGFLTHTMRLWT
jgi:hypothetical protein